MNTLHTPLRFITTGSVDDGKSTLIGRLLYDSQALLSDQLSSLEQNGDGDQLDFSSLTDGLEAEREQGITIDVAYRYFNTAQRKFIIADAPGHEQYTRNMVTGASNSDAAIVLIDATAVDANKTPIELLAQTKRHSAILAHLNVRHIIVAVNKMDLVGFDEARFNAIVSAYQTLAATLGLDDVRFIPISALGGDNVVRKSDHMPWYQGDALLSMLEHLPTDDLSDVTPAAFHLPVQRVARADANTADDFRGYQGRIESGRVTLGDAVEIVQNGQRAKVVEIQTPRGRVETAQQGDVVTIRLDKDVDVSRGDDVRAPDNNTNSALIVSQKINATVCWFSDTPLNPQRKYRLKHTTHTHLAKISAVHHVLDVHTLSAQQQETTSTVSMNDIATVSMTVQKPIAHRLYKDNKATGSFILIDDATLNTVGAGMIIELGDGLERSDELGRSDAFEVQA